MKRIVFLLIVFTVSTLSLSQGICQKTHKGLPDDLDSEKIVFLSFEQLDTDPRMQKRILKYYEESNKKSKEANEMLIQHAKDYPFEYRISERATYKELRQQGYKYVLNNLLMEEYNNGTPAMGSGIIYYSPLYIENIETGDRYELFDIKQIFVYRYDIIMKKFIKEVNQKFK